MPNNVRNILQINATSEKIEQVFKIIQSDGDPIPDIKKSIRS